MYDVCIIGAGVVGSAIARELSRYNLKVILCEKGADVGVGATKANSAIVHGGYTAAHGSLKGELSIRGNRMYDRLNEELNFGLRRSGSLVLAFDDEQQRTLESLVRNGEENGVKGLEILGQEAALRKDPNLNPEVRSALYCPETALTSPYEFCIALAENAVANGVELRLYTEIRNIEKRDGHFRITSADVSPHIAGERGRENDFHAAMVVNAAGIYSDKIAALLGDHSFEIHPRQGQYLLFRRGYGELVNHIIFQTPSEKGKGILVTPTYWGNLMIGPNSQEIPSREDVRTNREILSYIVRTARLSVPSFELSQVIRSFSGIRATSDSKDFIIRESKISGFFHAAGIDSPGLTASPAIAERVCDLLSKAGLQMEARPDFEAARKAITRPTPLQPFQKIKSLVDLPEGNPERIVCRCEQVREASIVDALSRGIPVDSTDAVKRRTRAGMGACQGQFCTPRVKKLIARETGIPEDTVGTRGAGSGLLPERVGPEELRKIEE